MKNLFTLLALFACTLFFSCSKEKSCSNNFNFYAELNDELQAVLAAQQTYLNDQTTANCEAFRTAYGNYLSEAKKLKDCAELSGQGAEYLKAIEDAEKSLNDIQC